MSSLFQKTEKLLIYLGSDDYKRIVDARTMRALDGFLDDRRSLRMHST